MSAYSCITCGVQFRETEEPPDACPICEDERQYVNPNGQQWTTPEALRADHYNEFKPKVSGLTGIGTRPHFAIGHRALLVQSQDGNVLWDSPHMVDEDSIAKVQALGGLTAIAISHPHFYGAMVDWSHAFGNVPIYIHASDQKWVMRPDPAIVFWEGTTQLLGESLTLINVGGHFAGSTVMHWAAGMAGQGVLLASDTPFVVKDQRYVSFMYSYPNAIPMPPEDVERIVKTLEPFSFERLYGGWFTRVVTSDAKNAVRRSAKRYLAHIGRVN